MRLACVATIALAVVVLSPSSKAAPCAGFTDVDTSSAFCVNVQWIRNRNITLGCTATLYCPNDPVTRLQMAAFLNRLGNVTFQQGGNAFGATGVAGTTDNYPLDIRVNNARVMRYEPGGNAPNVIGGHASNTVPGGFGQGATIGGGTGNEVTGCNGVVGGGSGNRAGGPSAYCSATVSGGASNSADGPFSAIAGGNLNTSPGWYSFVAAGFRNEATADGSFAAGYYARADGNNCAVFSLWGSSPGMPCFGIQGIFLVGAPNGLGVDYFSKRADGGGDRWLTIGRFGQTIAAWNGAVLTEGGVWTNASDAASKEAFEDVDRDAILDKLASLPLRSWRYKMDPPNVRRLGPTAQDFRAAFGFGIDDRTIATVDADGVALAAIQGLHEIVKRKDAQIDAQRATIERLAERLSELELRVAALAGTGTYAAAAREARATPSRRQ